MNRTGPLALVLLLLAGLLVLLARGGRGGKTSEEGPLFPEATEKNAERVEITLRDGKTDVLEKKGESWVVASASGYRAEAPAVVALFEKVAAMDARSFVSKSPEKRALFEVDTTGVRVAISGAGGKSLASFVIGKSGPDFQSNYLRPADSDKVYLTGELVRSAFDKGRRGWRDRKILSLAPEDVSALRITSGDTTLAFSKEAAGTWAFEGDPTRIGRAPVIEGVLRSLAGLTADEFGDSVSADTLGFDAPARSVEVTLTNGPAQRLVIGGPKSPTQHWVRRDGVDAIYVLFQGRIESLFKREEELTEPRPAPAEQQTAPAESAGNPG